MPAAPTQRQLMTRALIYMALELLFLIVAVAGKSGRLPQPQALYWFTYGGLILACIFCIASYRNFARHSARRRRLRLLKESTDGHS